MHLLLWKLFSCSFMMEKNPSPPYLNKHFHLKNSEFIFTMREELSMIPVGITRNWYGQLCTSSAELLEQGVNVPSWTEIFSVFNSREHRSSRFSLGTGLQHQIHPQISSSFKGDSETHTQSWWIFQPFCL